MSVPMPAYAVRYFIGDVRVYVHVRLIKTAPYNQLEYEVMNMNTKITFPNVVGSSSET